MSTQPKDMSNEELVKAWETGSKWLAGKMQMTGTKKDVSGEDYDHSTFLAGLGRIEKLEDELKLRGLKYGKV